MRIEHAVALVTGANRGLGLALTDRLVERGARVYAGVRDPSSGTRPGVVPVRLDITEPAAVAAAARRCRDVNLLINNAAIAGGGPLLGADAEPRARAEMETNYFGTLAMCRAFAPQLAGGALVNVLSILSFVSPPGFGSTAASKAAAWSMTRTVRHELRAQGTLVVGVHASFIDTRLAGGVDAPKHRPQDVADLVLDAVEAGQEEVLADERTRVMKATLPG